MRVIKIYLTFEFLLRSKCFTSPGNVMTQLYNFSGNIRLFDTHTPECQTHASVKLELYARVSFSIETIENATR